MTHFLAFQQKRRKTCFKGLFTYSAVFSVCICLVEETAKKNRRNCLELTSCKFVGPFCSIACLFVHSFLLTLLLFFSSFYVSRLGRGRRQDPWEFIPHHSRTMNLLSFWNTTKAEFLMLFYYLLFLRLVLEGKQGKGKENKQIVKTK